MKNKYLLLLIIYLLVNGFVFSDEEKQEKYSKNAISVDGLFLLPTLSVWSVSDFNNSFIITALQYERHISRTLSITGRFGYKYLYFDRLNVSAFSAEGHFRFYPAGNVFFLNGMIGYTYLDFERRNDDIKAHYATIGIKVGWRVNFDKSSGFILEPSLGYYMPFGNAEFQNSNNNFIIKTYLVGGFQFAFCMGFRF